MNEVYDTKGFDDEDDKWIHSISRRSGFIVFCFGLQEPRKDIGWIFFRVEYLIELVLVNSGGSTE